MYPSIARKTINGTPAPSGVVVKPIGIVLHLDPRNHSDIISDIAAQTTNQIKSPEVVAYHYVVDVGSDLIMETLSPIQVARNLREWYGSSIYPNGSLPNPDDLYVHVGISGIATCNGLASRFFFENILRLVCCLQNSFTWSAANPTIWSWQVDTRRYNESLNDNAADIVANLTAAIGARDCNAILQGDYMWEASALAGTAEGQRNFNAECFTCDDAHTGGGEPACTLAQACAQIDGLASSLNTLAQQVSMLTSNQAIIFGKLASLEAWKLTVDPELQTALAEYGAVRGEVDNIRGYLAAIKPCIECLCPTVVTTGIIEYQIPGDACASNNPFYKITPNISRHINFSVRVTDLQPFAVEPGPLWVANLPGGTWTTDVEVKIAPAEYCEGCTVWLDLIHCGQRTRVAVKTLSSGLQPVTINWSGDITVLAQCHDLHFEVGTDSTLGTPAWKCIESGYVRFTPNSI